MSSPANVPPVPSRFDLLGKTALVTLAVDGGNSVGEERAQH